jgi:NUMOD3 motif-containing protein
MSTIMSCVSSMTVESNLSVEFIYCVCGCKKTLTKYDNWGRKRKYIHGHWNHNKPYSKSKEIGRKISAARMGHEVSKETREKLRLASKDKHQSEETRKKIGIANKGKKLSEETKRKIGLANKGEKSGKWKGDDVRYGALHRWIRTHLPKPKDGLCILCHQNPFKEVACITGIYNREFNRNWAWFCPSCHHKWDNLARNLKNK